MDCKDRVYTKRTKEMKLRIKEIIRKRSNILVKKEVDLDMIVDYFSYACIFGEDVATEADKPEVSLYIRFNLLNVPKYGLEIFLIFLILKVTLFLLIQQQERQRYFLGELFHHLI